MVGSAGPRIVKRLLKVETDLPSSFRMAPPTSNTPVVIPFRASRVKEVVWTSIEVVRDNPLSAVSTKFKVIATGRELSGYGARSNRLILSAATFGSAAGCSLEEALCFNSSRPDPGRKRNLQEGS